jgi:acyl-coenzyme A synthetase/AMP-(fatty) acid ligase
VNLLTFTKMPPNNPVSLRDSIIATNNLTEQVIVGTHAKASWGELVSGTVLNERLVELNGSCVVLATLDQFLAIAALVELDGVARRIVLCPPDLSPESVAFVAECAGADVIFTDQPAHESIDKPVQRIAFDKEKLHPEDIGLRREIRSPQAETEWILLTSGTTGRPKLVAHTLASLAGAIERSARLSASVVWSTFYDTRRYGGLQIFLRSALTGASLILRGMHESTPDFLIRAGAAGVTHISGTPSQWRHALLSHSANKIAPKYVRLSGEIADQAILNRLHEQYPHAGVSHAFASTEAGVIFAVNDGAAGFPPYLLGSSPDMETKVEGDTLRVRSTRTAFRYLNKDALPIKDGEGFVDTGDVVELRDGRYYFIGRLDGTVNVGGMKVHPEEVEAVINRHPEVSVSLVRPKRNRITGGLVVADVVLRVQQQPSRSDADALQSDILQFCRGELARHKVPVAINFVPTLAVAETGKLVRPLA